jgi:hypothetical protein
LAIFAGSVSVAKASSVSFICFSTLSRIAGSTSLNVWFNGGCAGFGAGAGADAVSVALLRVLDAIESAGGGGGGGGGFGCACAFRASILALIASSLFV